MLVRSSVERLVEMISFNTRKNASPLNLAKQVDLSQELSNPLQTTDSIQIQSVPQGGSFVRFYGGEEELERARQFVQGLLNTIKSTDVGKRLFELLPNGVAINIANTMRDNLWFYSAAHGNRMQLELCDFIAFELNENNESTGDLVFPISRLFHELYHIVQKATGERNPLRLDYPQGISEYVGTSLEAEIQAMHAENALRSELGLPLRVSYVRYENIIDPLMASLLYSHQGASCYIEEDGTFRQQY